MKRYLHMFALLALLGFGSTLRAQSLIPFSDGTKWGYETPDGKTVVEAKYVAVSLPAGHYGLVCEKVGGQLKWGVVEASGLEVIPPSYDYIDLCNEGIVAVYTGKIDSETDLMTDGKWGYIKLDNPGTVELDGLSLAGPFVDSVAWVDISSNTYVKRQKRTMPIVNNKGKVIGENIIFGVSSSFDMKDIVLPKEDGSYPFGNGNWVLVNRNMTPVTNPDSPYQMVGTFKDGLAWVKKNGKYGFVNCQGVEVIPPVYDNVQDAPDAKAVSLRLNPESGAIRWVMNSNGEIAWLNEKGEIVINFIKSDGRIEISEIAEEQMWDF